ncbi:hypothetical protein BBO99_00005721 [Phytophthora kernoviae]|uniref:Arrestin C-terminal-like domain-containing protein n=1 Tax=Phytophthora kernoviae TaxID=325452 RepID=A0A3R7H8Z5_9STRA|nr:hypothetical protein JM16_006873 [Phytophthora kernoviae]KAG2525241.1 hypothetical protein JM18_004980 [Phytophthora kernoviae]RLN36993.1 hypothetical protein BBI17_005758 [Phytophthora kernoviae]RLN78783.1 hypothetical protein BBO99_00005721 [Phytophthora kernoviae]
MGKLAKAFGLDKKGKIGLAVEKPSYIAGELVRGTIYVDIHESIACDALVLKVTGKEKVEFTHIRREIRDGESVGVEQRDHVSRDKEFFKQKLVIFDTQGQNYEPGRYTYPFQYQLPAELPGAFKLSGYSNWDIENLSAKIKYKFKATLDVGGFFASDLKADCDLVVHGRNFQALVPSEDSVTQEVKFLCCFSRGTCQLAVAMNKSVYLPGETAQLQCNISNGSTVEISTMRCRLYQDVRVQLSKGSTRTCSKVMCENAFPGVPPGATLTQPQPLTLVPDHAGFLQPSTTGELIACSYRIEIECDIPWCPDVHLHLPVSIIAPELPNPGAGWIPE